MKQKCMRCFNEYAEGISACPYCGFRVKDYAENEYTLPMRTVLGGRYIIGVPLGHGGFGVTYAAWDSLLEKKVAIKEYLPTDFATRSLGSYTVKVHSTDNTEKYQKGVDSFLNESRRLARFSSVPGVVKIFDCFNENNTAYIVMEYLEGKTLAAAVEEKGKLPWQEAVQIMQQSLAALEPVHAEGIIHRDIAPDNIFLCDDGSVKLIDFGAARYVTTSHSRSLSVMLKVGYAPVEQYSSKGNQGPWTDVYACGATLYYAITGVKPVDSYDRMDETKTDKLAPPSRYVKKLPQHVETAILNAMNILPENRTQSAKAFAEELAGTVDVKRIKEKLEHEDTGKIPWWMKIHSVAAVIAALAAVLLLALGIGTVIVNKEKSTVPSGMARVPDVVTQEPDEAENTLADAPLKMVISDRIFDSFYDKVSVILQNPYAGGVAYENSVVNVTLSGSSDEKVIMPDLSYYPQELARQKLESLGLMVRFTYLSDETVADRCVLHQNIEAGKTVAKGKAIVLKINQNETGRLSGEQVVVPDIVGMQLENATAALKERGLFIRATDAQYSSQHEAGIVMAQETAEGKSVPAGTVINVTVSIGRQKSIVPDVLYMQEQAAKDKITHNNLQYRVLYAESDKVAKGVVLKQSPASGSTVESQSTVTITVSTGYKVTVPYVVGRKESDARSALSGAGLGCRVVYEPSDSVSKGSVIRQSPQNGNKVEQGTVVEIVVSSGTSIVSVTGVSLNNHSASLNLNERLTLVVTVSPNNASNTVVSWSSSDSGVAAVDGNGIVTARSIGSAVITVTTADGGFTDTCSITVVKNVTGIAVSGQKTQYLLNESFQKPTVTASYDDGTTANVTSQCTFEGFDSSKETTSQVTVSYTYSGKTVRTSYNYSVIEDTLTLGVTSVDLTLSSSPTRQLNAQSQKGRPLGTVTWKSSDTSVASVNSSGLVTANAIGRCEIGAINAEGLYDTCQVNVWKTTEVVTYKDESGNVLRTEVDDDYNNSAYEKQLVSSGAGTYHMTKHEEKIVNELLSDYITFRCPDGRKLESGEKWDDEWTVKGFVRMANWYIYFLVERDLEEDVSQSEVQSYKNAGYTCKYVVYRDTYKVGSSTQAYVSQGRSLFN